VTTSNPPTERPSGIWGIDSSPQPEVWWGVDGIDALIWADPRPYEHPPTSELRPEAGDAE
jgi:hypothetical protein